MNSLIYLCTFIAVGSAALCWWAVWKLQDSIDFLKEQLNTSLEKCERCNGAGRVPHGFVSVPCPECKPEEWEEMMSGNGDTNNE